MAKLIGTAGHVDHGKTTLIKALTGIDADRLPEEKKRGMTIDIGFAYIDLPRHGRVSIVDVPGHERFLTNMLVGALGIDVALLCVSADESVMPQTREHLEILDLLPVEKMVVAMTRADLADAEVRGLCRTEIDELLAGGRFAGSPVFEVSAHTGEGIEALRAALDTALDGETAPARGPWYLPIDRVFTVKGHGCVVTGTLAQGAVRVGDRAVLQPGGLEVRVRSIHSHEESLEVSEKGRRTALNLSGAKAEDVRRGMGLGEPGALFETTCLDAKVLWSTPPKHAQRVRVSVGAEEAIGKLFLSDQEPEIAQVRLETPVAVAKGQPLILRRYSPPDLLAGGRVVVPVAVPRRKGEAVVRTEAESDDAAVIEVLAANPAGVPTEEVCRLLGKTPQALGTVFEALLREGRAIGFAGLWFRTEDFASAAERLLAALGAAHEAEPMAATQPRERVVKAAGFGWSGKPLDRILAHLAGEGRIVVEGTAVRAAGFRVALKGRQQELLERVVTALEAEPVNTPGPSELAQKLTVPPQAIDEIVKLGVAAGELRVLGDGIVYTVRQLEGIRSTLEAKLGDRGFSAAEARDALGTTRKYVIPILEYLDASRFTQRTGDMRRLVRRS